uniref:T-complex protein 1 subunit alpha n=1 Tax=Colobus angolensis palliatus TaxID=336983 RepID=A0A2K5HMW5_COLAP
GALSVYGDRSTGEAIRYRNEIASIANIVKSSLGPVGLDKMLVDDIGDVTITNDGATILKLLEVEHPAAKVLCELADLQDKEVGDGTTSVYPHAYQEMGGKEVDDGHDDDGDNNISCHLLFFYCVPVDLLISPHEILKLVLSGRHFDPHVIQLETILKG